MPDIILRGCTPEPLMSYLKSLGILRVVSQQKDREARGAWGSGTFLLETRLEEAELTRFFIEEYRPTPIVAPWAGGSGFFGQDNRKAVDAIALSDSPRLGEYRRVIEEVRAILLEEGQENKPSDEDKERLIRRYRRDLSDSFVSWMDCALVLLGEGQAFPPILGTGGNDGRLDFTQNFMQRIVDLGMVLNEPPVKSISWLRQALMGEGTGGLLPVAIGQFDPGRAGGPNAGQGMEGGSFVNPWDYVLMLEGALMLAGSVARRMGTHNRDKAAFPFTVRTSAVGYGSAGDQDGTTGRGEVWLPLWSKFASFAEIQQVFAEGRANVSGRQSRDSVDFARAVAGLGVDRGITSFVRYGFLKRSGKAFVATPEGYFEVNSRPEVDLVAQIDDWLERFRRAARSENTPPRFSAAARRIDAAIFDCCRYGGTRCMAELLCALGNAERELANGEKFRSNDKRTIHPLPMLSPQWIAKCDDGTVEYRLALSLAFIRGHPDIADIRTNLEAVERHGQRWQWAEKGRAVVWSGADLERNLLAVLSRRVMDSRGGGADRLPLKSVFPVALNDIGAFLTGGTDDRRVEELLWGLLLVDNARGDRESWRGDRALGSSLPIPRAYALLKLLFLPSPVSWPAGSDGINLKPEPEILGRLRAGALQGACDIAVRRLRASGLIPMPGKSSGKLPGGIEAHSSGTTTSRLAAALLFPVYEMYGTKELGTLVLRPKKEELTATNT